MACDVFIVPKLFTAGIFFEWQCICGWRWISERVSKDHVHSVERRKINEGAGKGTAQMIPFYDIDWIPIRIRS